MSARFDDVCTLLRRIAPFPAETVVAGAWVPPLYRLALRTTPHATVTRDLDVGFDASHRAAPAQCDWLERIGQRLIAADWTVEVRGVGYGLDGFAVLVPPSHAGGRFPELEFIAQVDGGGRRGPTVAARFPGRIRPQEVRELRILFAEPWRVDVDADVAVPVPNPLSFVLQKVLIRSARSLRAKDAKDAQGIVEVAHLYADEETRLDGLAARLRAHSKEVARKADRAVRLLVDRRFAGVARIVERALEHPPPHLALDGAHARERVVLFLRRCGITTA